MEDIKKRIDTVNKCRKWATSCRSFGVIFFFIGYITAMIVPPIFLVGVLLRLAFEIVSCILKEHAKKLEAR